MENQHVLACGVSRFPNEEAKKKFPQNYLKGAQKNNGVLQLVIRNAPEWCSIPPPQRHTRGDSVGTHRRVPLSSAVICSSDALCMWVTPMASHRYTARMCLHCNKRAQQSHNSDGVCHNERNTWRSWQRSGETLHTGAWRVCQMWNYFAWIKMFSCCKLY